MSLRARLLAATMVTALLALGIIDFATYTYVRKGQIEQLDADLERSHPPVERAAEGRGDVGVAIRAVAPASYVELRNPDGTPAVMVPLIRPGAPNIDLRHVALQPADAGGDAAVFRTVDLGEDSAVRVRVSRQDDGRTLIIGQSMALLDRTEDRLIAVLSAATIGAVLVVAAVGVWLVGLGLAPLHAVERAASEVSEDDLDIRVPEFEETTEVGRLSKAINTMLDRLADALRQHRSEAAARKESEARMRRFVGDASHELRTPLAAVSAYAELFDRGARERPEDLERAMAGIRDETARMTDLIDDLLLLAQIDEGRPLAEDQVDLADVAAAAVQAARVVDPDRHVGLRVDDVGRVRGDARRLRQVVDNLLANVRAHTPAGTACLVDVRRDADDAVLTVIDDGPGLDDDEVRAATDRFYRSDASRARSSGGTGLGLSIVAAIVEAHGGRLTLDTLAEGGLEVSVRIPSSTPAAEGPDADE